MIYEVRTYQLKPRAVPEFMDLFEKAYPIREKVSKLGGMFYTDIGPLNEVVHIWPYKNLADREKKRAKFSGKNLGWPPQIGHLVVDMRTEFFNPAPFTPKMKKGKLGPIFEWREYQILPGRMDELYAAWEKQLPKRLKLSPLVMAMHTEVGELHKFVHLWAYRSLDQRSAVRSEAMAKGIWPPKRRKEMLRSQKNKILLAAPFSPVR